MKRPEKVTHAGPPPPSLGPSSNTSRFPDVGPGSGPEMGAPPEPKALLISARRLYAGPPSNPRSGCPTVRLLLRGAVVRGTRPRDRRRRRRRRRTTRSTTTTTTTETYKPLESDKPLESERTSTDVAAVRRGRRAKEGGSAKNAWMSGTATIVQRMSAWPDRNTTRGGKGGRKQDGARALCGYPCGPTGHLYNGVARSCRCRPCPLAR